MGSSPRRPDLGPLAAEVMEVLWRAGAALPVRGVLDELNSGRDRPLAYTTVMTVLGRLADRDVVRRERSGRGYAYRAVAVSPAEVAVRRVLDDYGEAAIVSFLDQVDGDEALRARLHRLVAGE